MKCFLETQAAAEEGARAVKLTYKDVERPVMDVKEAAEKNMIHEGSTESQERGNAEGMPKILFRQNIAFAILYSDAFITLFYVIHIYELFSLLWLKSQ